jgi:hypothetical protein
MNNKNGLYREYEIRKSALSEKLHILCARKEKYKKKVMRVFLVIFFIQRFGIMICHVNFINERDIRGDVARITF